MKTVHNNLKDWINNWWRTTSIPNLLCLLFENFPVVKPKVSDLYVKLVPAVQFSESCSGVVLHGQQEHILVNILSNLQFLKAIP